MYCENCGKTVSSEDAMILKESLTTSSYYCPKCYALKKKQLKKQGRIFMLSMVLLAVLYYALKAWARC